MKLLKPNSMFISPAVCYNGYGDKKMFTLMLVDDNRLALEFFSKMVDWNQYGFQLVCAACDGEAALIEFKRLRPDVVITDVQMPNMNGIDLAREIRAIAPQTFILFLSSYEEFSYLHNAMQLGVFDYILKHEINPDELGKKLLRLRQTMENQQQEGHYIAEGNLSCFLEDPQDLQAAADSSWLQHFPRHYDLLIFYRDQFVPVIEQLLHKQVDKIPFREIKSFFYEYEQTEAVLKLSNGAALVLSLHQENMLETIYAQKDAFRARFHQSASMLVLAQDAPIVDCLMQFRKHKDGLMQKYFYPPSSVLYDHMMHSSSATITPVSQEQIAALLEQKQADTVCRQLDEHYLAVIRANDYNAFESIVNAYIPPLLAWHHKLTDPAQKSVFSAYTDTDARLWYDIPSIFIWLKARYAVLAPLIRDYSPASAAVQRVVLYIHQHYGNCDLGAESIADHFHTNVNKLNAMMKKEVGCTVWKLLIQVRMEKARQLLDETDMKVIEICEAVGYKAMSHFSDVFKKYYGISPREYRRTHEE